MPQHEVIQRFFEFTGALAVITSAMAWWRKDSPADDAMVSEAADVVLGTLSDADTVSKVDLHTAKNLRDQLTIEEAIELNRERELRRFERRN